MKILWFTNTPCGATEKLTGCKVTGGGWLFALSEQLKKKAGVELHIAFYYKNKMQDFEYDGIYYHPIFRESYQNRCQMIIGQFKSRFSKKYDTSSIDKVKSVIDIVAPDVVHIHGSEESYGLVAKKINTQNVVLSIQGLIAPCKEKLFVGIPESEIRKHESFLDLLLFTGSRSISKRMNLDSIREKDILKSINHIIGRTKWDYDCSLSYNPNRKYYLVNEILRSEFLQHDWVRNNSSHHFTLATTVSNGLFKGVESIYKAAIILKDAGMQIQWNLIGLDQSDSIVRITEAYVGAKASYLGINLLGRMDAKQMISVLDESDIFVQVSHIENSPNSLCEAMAIGMPIVATFAGGTSSMLSDGEEGVLVQDGDSYSMAGAIMHAFQDYSHMLDMALRAQKKARARHNADNVCDELMHVYSNIVQHI